MLKSLTSVSNFARKRFSANRRPDVAITKTLLEIADSSLFDLDFYVSQLNRGSLTWEEAGAHYLNAKSKDLLDPHPLFDSAYYVRSNQDVAFDKLNPLIHFLRGGWRENRNPHPLFDMLFYLDNNPDVASLGINPLSHFLFSGANELRDPSAFFNMRTYAEQLGADYKSLGNLLIHFIVKGAEDGISPHQLFNGIYCIKPAVEVSSGQANFQHAKFEYLTDSFLYNKLNLGAEAKALEELFDARLFDRDFFCAQINRELTWLDCLKRYAENWAEEGLDPHPLFDTSFYVNCNQDVDFSIINPYIHFISRGWVEGRNPHPLFDISHYLENNKDIRRLGINPLIHFMLCGARERREFSTFFDVVKYERELRIGRISGLLKDPDGMRHSYDRSLKIKEQALGRKWRKPSNLLLHFLTQDSNNKVLPTETFEFFFTLKRKNYSGKNGDYTFWKVLPRDLKNSGQVKLQSEALARLTQRICDAEFVDNEIEIVKSFMHSLTLRWNCTEFLGGEKIIFLATHEASRTGAPMLLLRLVKDLASRGWECVVLANDGGELEGDFTRVAHFINFRNSRSRYEECANYLELLLGRLKYPSPKLCMLNSLETTKHAKTFRDRGIKVVSLVHEIADVYPSNHLNDTFKNSDVVIYPAAFVQQKANLKAETKAKNAEIIPSALLEEDFGIYPQAIGRQSLRREIKAAEDSVVVLACGTPDLRKGIDLFATLTQVVLKKIKSDTEVHFVWIGADKIKSLSAHYFADWDLRQAGLKSRVHFLPTRKDLRPAFAGADIFVLTSRQDPFPCVVHNAMAAGLPIIAFDNAGGVPEMVAGGGGSMIPYGDIEAFAEAVLNYTNNKEQRIADGQLNARMVHERFHFEDYVVKIEAVISRLLESQVAVKVPSDQH